ncbi:MAG: CDP-diacylglycerol--glycerol-3-phosphate 3-phosphatidyltransferase [Parcubacteria group bacterium Greene0416_79]|nr:MAG: CDP-diacylglycerol--glycerol-3-phosphate 3-phosphatidyltransferase [Parcubacteria group bacterium Greene0416_79]
MMEPLVLRRKKSDTVVERVLSESKRRYLAKVTVTDTILAAVVLPFIPRFVTPNHITVFRFICIPFVLAALLLKLHLLATVLFAIAAFSDAVDGALARTRDAVSSWGIMFDPLADKLLVSVTAVVLISSVLNSYIALTVVLLEVCLIASVYFRYGGNVVPAKTAGKIKMVLQCVGLGLLLLYVNIGGAALLAAAKYTLYAAILFAFLSLFVYRSI